VVAWDVVNEAFDSNGNLFDEVDYRNINKRYVNVWKEHLGTGYIARSFIYAHEADPNAVLFYNDNSQEIMPDRMQAIVKMVNIFKSKHIPIGGIGLQMHMDIRVTEEGIKYALQQAANTGLQVRISELDIRLNPGNHRHDPDSLSNAKRQAYLYAFVVKEYKAIVPVSQQKFGITLWGITDGDSWINNTQKVDAPNLFDEHYNKKPVYAAFSAVLNR
jgi:endo-1,4-beta-xylanase